jgi:hypothetical protein
MTSVENKLRISRGAGGTGPIRDNAAIYRPHSSESEGDLFFCLFLLPENNRRRIDLEFTDPRVAGPEPRRAGPVCSAREVRCDWGGKNEMAVRWQN